MKSILISIKPKYVAKILNREKTIEVRKTAPKCDLPVEVYIYCTKGSEKLIKSFDVDDGPFYVRYKEFFDKGNEYLNGKVVAKFTLREIEDASQMNSSDGFRFINEARISYDEFLDYLYKGKEQIFGWHISDLVIFDRPMELRDFRNFNQWNGNEIDPYTMTKAPQSWCYCEEVLE